MQAEDLDRRIKLFQSSSTTDEYNAEVNTLSSLGSMWAGARDEVEDEGIAGGQRSANVRTIFTIRYRPDIRPDHKMKVEFDGQDYEVVQVRRLPGRGKGFELTCELDDGTGARGL